MNDGSRETNGQEGNMMRTLIVIITIVIGLVASARADDRYVWRDCPTPGSGYTNWTIAATSIHQAVDVAGAGETVWVTNGTYELTNQVTVLDFKVISMNGPTQTFINGNNYAGKPVTNRCFYLNHANALVSGFTVSNGWQSTEGDGRNDFGG